MKRPNRPTRGTYSGLVSMPSRWFAEPAAGGPPCPICGRSMYRGDLGYVCGAPGPQHGGIYDPATGRPAR